MPGPEESRLIQALEGAHPGKANGGATDWDTCAGLLEKVSANLAQAQMPVEPGDAGAETAAAITASFQRSSKAMKERAVKLREGKKALEDAAQAIKDANDAHIALGTEEGAPTYKPHDDPNSPAGIKKHNAYLDEMSVFNKKKEHREKVSREQAEKLDAAFKKSSATMKEIHGIPDPPPVPPPYQPGNNHPGGGNHTTPPRHTTGPSGNNNNSSLQPIHHFVMTDPDNDHIIYNPGHNTDDTVGSPQDNPTTVTPGTTTPGTTSPTIGSTGGGTSGVSGSTGLGLAGAAAGGIGGGALGMAGGIRGGGMAPISAGGGTAASGVRGIGATSRSGGAGTLGRSSTVGAGSGTGAGRGTGARTGASAAGRGSGAGGRGGRGAAGSRGGAGGRGAAGAGAGGRSGRSKDDEKAGRHDEFDIDEDWIDDEDIAPGVIS